MAIKKDKALPDYIVEHRERRRQQEVDGIQNRLADAAKKDLVVNLRRDRREQWLFWVALASLGISIVSLWIAGLALQVACLQK